MLQFLVIPILLGLITVSMFRACKPLGLLCGIGLFAYMLAQPLGGFIVWMVPLVLIWVAIKVLGSMFSLLS
jgi:hypothetical protein